MIKINGKIVEINKFPDGTPRINIDINNVGFETYLVTNSINIQCINIEWFYENDGEMFYLMLVKRHLEEYFSNVYYHLYVSYLPNARMDRTKSKNEVFTLKYFCDFINSLNFSRVFVTDVHSKVSIQLLNNCVNIEPKKYIKNALNSINENVVLYFPDKGASERYKNLFINMKYCYGEKRRDWETGIILGLNIITNGIDLKNKTILMIDDIISYGGSLYYSAKTLKEYGVDKIYAYATHVENSILDKEKGTLIKLLENNTIERLFTTNSLFNKEHEKITVMEVK